MTDTTATDTIATDALFTPDAQTALKALAGLIIAASPQHQIPGADDPIIFEDILISAADTATDIQAAIRHAQSICGPTLENENTAQTRSKLEGLPQMAPVIALVMQCYYRDDRVMRSLNMEPRPPFPKGYEVPEGDWSMLESVQRRGKIWRDA